MESCREVRRGMECLITKTLFTPVPERPELRWLKRQFDQFAEKEGIAGKKMADLRLYERLYGQLPQKETDTLKIRYWRTGRHLPATYEQCQALGWALHLDQKDQRFLLQGYYDSCDHIFLTEPETGDVLQTLYQARLARLRKLVTGYLTRISPEQLAALKIEPESIRRYIRHLYYTDAMQCIHWDHSLQKFSLSRHISSINYDSELKRTLKLLGVIPRKTIIRHLFILGMPDVSLDFMNTSLAGLGYLPLQAEHTLRTGERLDALIIGFLQYCDAACPFGWVHVYERCLWMQQALRIMDELLAAHGLRRQRFMLFKSLENL